MHLVQLLTALGRSVHIVNLDPATPDPTYPCAINIIDLISLDEVMDEHGLGPNGAILYCIEYLEKNWDWLVDKLDELLAQEEDQSRGGYIIFDTPGQVELWTNHDSLKNVINRLTKLDYRVSSLSQVAWFWLNVRSWPLCTSRMLIISSTQASSSRSCSSLYAP